MQKLGMQEGEPIEHNMISRAIENAQAKVEGHNFEIRKQLLEYDDVMNQQREVIYRQRREALEGKDLKDAVMEMIRDKAEELADIHAGDSAHAEEWDQKEIQEAAYKQFNFRLESFDEETLDGLNRDGLAEMIYEAAAERYNEALQQRLAEAGARLDAVYYCPHYPEATVEEYRVDCDCRKPKPGMLKSAEKALELDLAQSYMVGDKSIDIEAGKRAGCRTILVKTGYGSEELKRNHVDCDYIAEDLDDAARHIVYGEGE